MLVVPLIFFSLVGGGAAIGDIRKLGSVRVPLETIASAAGVNRLLDMMRTMTNGTGNAVVAVAVGRMAGEIDVEEYVSADDV